MISEQPGTIRLHCFHSGRSNRWPCLARATSSLSRPGLVNEVYGGRVTDAMLETEGRYVHSEGDANWWIPSGRIFYSPGSEDTSAQELAYASQHFFLPHRYRDPFHTNDGQHGELRQFTTPTICW